MSDIDLILEGAMVAFFVLGALVAFFIERIGRERNFFRKPVTVYQWDYGLLYENGRFARLLNAGRHRMSGLANRLVVCLPRRPQFEQLLNVDVTSSNRLSYRLSASVVYTIEDPRCAHEGGYREELRRVTSSALRHVAAERTVETALAERATLGEATKACVGSTVCGCTISEIAIVALSLPPELRRLYTEVERARLEGQAALERARGEQAALRSLANSARMLKGNPELMNLRLLQALSVGGGKAGATLVLGREAFATTPMSERSGVND